MSRRDSLRDDRTQAWAGARRILAVRLDGIGDVLMTTPAIRALRDSGPDRHVTLLTSPAGAQAAEMVPEIGEVIVYEPPWMKATPAEHSASDDRAMIDRLARSGFDAAVIFTVYSQNPLPAALFCQLAEIRLRLAHCRENPYQLLTDWVPEVEPEHELRHEVQRQLDLVATVGARTLDERLSLDPPYPARARTGVLLAELGVTRERSLVVVHPGATAPSRRWPAERFGEVARELAEHDDAEVLVTGTQDEAELGETVTTVAPAARSLIGQLTLDELAALVETADLLVSNNTGVVHVAAAVGTPVVDLYALTNPQHTPWRVASRVLSHDVPCRNCYKSVCPMGHHACLREVSAEQTIAAARELLGATARQPIRIAQ